MTNSTCSNFLLELGTEELPPLEISNLVTALTSSLSNRFASLGLSYTASRTFASPRRLAVLFTGLVTRQPDQIVELRGPSMAVAFDQAGQPTMAALKFAAKCNTDLSKLQKIENNKGVFLYYRNRVTGSSTMDLLPSIIIDSIVNLSCKKAMYWGNHIGPFTRPLRWIVALLGDTIVDFELWGIKAGRETLGHRSLRSPSIVIAEAANYEQSLVTVGHVMADPAKRCQMVMDDIQKNLTDDLSIDEELLAEVINLVEWPHVTVGTFEERFLQIPQEVLTTTLKNHQRCFASLEHGELKNRFFMISNLDDTKKNIVRGCERVIAARFSDAAYFYKLDLQQPLHNNLEKLKGVTFQDGLGSLYDKTMRLVVSMKFIALKLNLDSEIAQRAALLAKCDLVSAMTGEFPELQGIMGYYYALQQNESQEIALAIKEHYLPRFAKDDAAASEYGIALALVDRVDTLVGLFALNKMPTGEKDPLGLRRTALSIVRTILDRNVVLDLRELIEYSCEYYNSLCKNRQQLTEQLLTFIYDRLQHLYLERGENINVIRAILATFPVDLADFTKRLKAVNNFIQLPTASDLLELYKRVYNILRAAKILRTASLAEDWLPNGELLQKEAERDLTQILVKLSDEISDLYHGSNYGEILAKLLMFKEPLSYFFDKVMVMVDDQELRNHRLAMLKKIHGLFSIVADFSFLISGSDKIK